VEALTEAPTVLVTSCGHIFHYHCLAKKIETKWWTPRIFFECALCPLCKTWMTFEKGNPLEKIMSEITILYEDVKKKSMTRLKHEDRHKDKRLSKKGDPFFGKPLEYAMAIYSYYLCFKCKTPYFGGLKKCEAMRDEANNNA